MRLISKIRETLKRTWLRVKGRRPHKLPAGREEFHTFCDKVILTYGFPDLPTYRNAVAQEIMQLDKHVHKMPLAYFNSRIQSTVTKQVAYTMMKEIEKKAKEERDLENAETKTEATPH